MELITSIQNQKIKELVSLRTERASVEQVFFLDGLHLCEEAVHQHRLTAIYLEQTKWGKLPKFLESFEGPIYWLSETVSKKVSGTKNPTGIYGVAKIIEQEWIKSGNVLVLDDVQDPGNLGTLLRSAAAFNFPNILISPKSVSFYNEKVLRSTQGLIFQLKLQQAELEPFLETFKKQGLPIIGTSLKKPFQLLTVAHKQKQPLVLIMGNEGHGLSVASEKSLTKNILIPMAAHVDSLNVGVAGSIMMYELNQK